jgi:hypothetical protein
VEEILSNMTDKEHTEFLTNTLTYKNERKVTISLMEHPEIASKLTILPSHPVILVNLSEFDAQDAELGAKKEKHSTYKDLESRIQGQIAEHVLRHFLLKRKVNPVYYEALEKDNSLFKILKPTMRPDFYVEAIDGEWLSFEIKSVPPDSHKKYKFAIQTISEYELNNPEAYTFNADFLIVLKLVEPPEWGSSVILWGYQTKEDMEELVPRKEGEHPCHEAPCKAVWLQDLKPIEDIITIIDERAKKSYP